MTIKTPEKHNITVNKTEGDDRELSCTCGWTPKSPILVQFVPAIVERHTQMNRGT
jgi:hypothetical protein